MHVRDELAHVLEGGTGRLDHDLQTRIQDLEVEVGDDHGDLDELIDRRVEPGHLAVDPDESVVLSCAHVRHSSFSLRIFFVPQGESNTRPKD